MEALLNRYRNLTVLLVVIMAQLLLLAYQVKTNQDVRLIRVWAVTAVTPLARVLEFARRNTIGIAEDYLVLVKVREQNRTLTEENGRLKLENQFLKSELQTAERARLLSAFQERTPSRTLPARIIGNATGSNARVVFIDRGSANGVMRGMAVVTPEGIVGKVLAAYPTASQVQLITDGTFAAGVISQKNRVYGTLKGTGQSKCIVDYVQNEEKVEQGEMFFTSGDDRVFPKGMPVGTVTVVKPGKGFKEITVVPTAFQQGLEEVLVVLEGVHQSIPDKSATPSTPVKILPPPPPEGGQVISQQPGGGAPAGAAGTPAAGTPAGSGSDLRSGLSTTADRLKDRYKRIGEMQNHTFGEGLPGSKPPDFTLNPDAPKAKPQAPAAPAGAPAVGAAATGGATPTGQPTTAPVKQPPPTPGQTTPAKPQGAPTTTPGETTAPTAAKPSAPKPASAPAGTAVVPQTPAPDAAKPQTTPPPSAKPKPATPADSTASPPSGERNRAAPVQPAPQSSKPKPRQQPPESLPFP